MTTTEIPGYVAGTWQIDAAHSDITFVVRHLGVSKVRGRFDQVETTIVTGGDIIDSQVTTTIHATSVDTNNQQRDAHVRSADFLDVENHPTITFTSTGIRLEDDEYVIDGELTMHGVTKPVTLATELGGFTDGPAGKVLGVSATTEISRSDFEVGKGIPTAVVSDKIKIELDIEAGLQA